MNLNPKKPETRNRFPKEATMARMYTTFAVAAMMAAVLFTASPALAQTCNKRKVLSVPEAKTVLMKAMKKGDYCTPYLANKVIIDKTFANTGCTPANFKVDFASCTKPPAPADKDEVASKACKKASMLNGQTLLNAWLGDKASDCTWQNANRDKLVADLAAHQCSPADFNLDVNKCDSSPAPADKEEIADDKPANKPVEPLQAQLLALRSVNIDVIDVLTSLLDKIGKLIPQNTEGLEAGEASVSLLEDEKKKVRRKKLRQIYTDAGDTAGAVLSILKGYDTVFRGMKDDLGIKLEKYKQLWNNTVAGLDSNTIKALLKKAEDTLATLEGPEKTQLATLVDDAKKADTDEKKVFHLARFFGALPITDFNKAAGINEKCPEPKSTDTKDTDSYVNRTRGFAGPRSGILRGESSLWLPPLVLRTVFGGSLDTGGISDANGLGVDAKGNIQALRLGAEGYHLLGANISFMWGADFEIARRETLFHHELQGNYLTSVGTSVGVIGRLGINLFGYVNLYGMGIFRFRPGYGGGGGGGIELTGIPGLKDTWANGVRIGFEAMYAKAYDQLTPMQGSTPVDFSGVEMYGTLGYAF